jgi:hypothetical protein
MEEIRGEIAKDYCRSIVLLDDDINPDDVVAYARFSSFADRCSTSAILCHLFPYPKTHMEPDDDECRPVIQKAVNLAKYSDLIILDWHLTGTESPSHAKRIIKEVAATDSVKFLIINTQVEIESLEEELRELLPGDFGRLDDSEIGTTTNQGEEDENPNLVGPTPQMPLESSVRFHYRKRLFISARKKGDVTTVDDATPLLEHVFKSLTESYSDHLHWAGLELASRIRKILPRIIAAFPSGIDSPLLLEMLYQKSDDVAHRIADLILDELKSHFLSTALKSVSDAVLLNHLAASIVKAIDDKKFIEVILPTVDAGSAVRLKIALEKEVHGDSLNGNDKTVLQEFNKLRENWKNPVLEDIRASISQRTRDHFYLTKEREERKKVAAAIDLSITGQNILGPHADWACFNENVLLFEKESYEVQQGMVLYNLLSSRGEPRYSLCITPSCDCYRPETIEYRFLFILGSPYDPQKAHKGKEITSSSLGRLHIAWDATKLVVLLDPLCQKPTAMNCQYQVVGQLRPNITQRIIQRIWSYQSRVGIDTSEYIRDLRDED